MRLSRAAKTYLLCLVALVLWALFVIVDRPASNTDWQLLLTPLFVFAAISFLIQIYEIELVHRGNISITHPIFIATLLLGGIPLALATMAISTCAAEVLLRWPVIKESGIYRFAAVVTFNTCQIIVSAFAASGIFILMGGHQVLPSGHVTSSTDPFTLIVAASAAFFAYAMISNALVSGIISLTQRSSFIYNLRFILDNLLVQILSLGALGILLAEVYSHSPWNLLLVLIPMGLVHSSLRNYMRLRLEAQKTLQNVTKMLAQRDPYTYQHSEGVEVLAGDVARVLGLSQDEIEDVKAAALIHDIGKLAVPDRILLKAGPLTPEERKEMEKHPVVGAELLKNLEIYRGIVSIVRHEHERWDGNGYPDGLNGEEIPLGARIISVADAYNAMTTDRPYRKALTKAEAIQELKDKSGSQFDPRLVRAALQALGVLEPEPYPFLKKAWQTAVPFTPILVIAILLLITMAA